MNVYQKLAKARVQLQNSGIKKSGMNKFAGFKYFELNDFLPTVNDIFDKLGLCSRFVIGEPTIDAVTGLVETPERAELTIFNAEKPEEQICFSSATAEAPMKGALPIQQLGSVHTYMRRYLWLEAMEICESDGVDAVDQKAQEAPPKPVQKPKGAQITDAQLARIIELFAGNDERLNAMMNVYQVRALEELSAKQAENIIRRMESNGVRNN